jgi:N,N'-diacetylchitobiose transport system permease protein
VTITKIFKSLAIYVFAFAVIIASVFPVYWMINTALTPNGLTRGETPSFFPTSFTLENFETILFDQQQAAFIPALINSLSVTILTVLFALAFAFLSAIALSRFQFLGRRTFLVLILVVQMIPGEAMIISTFRLINDANLLNSIAGLTIVYVATVLPFTIWMLRGFVNGVPQELEESAMVDGCTRQQAFRLITLPLLAPGLVATGVFGFIQAWNEFLLALVINGRPEMMTLPVWLRTYQQVSNETDWAAIMAGSSLMTLPVLIFFMIVQGRMTSGLVAGAVKG